MKSSLSILLLLLCSVLNAQFDEPRPGNVSMSDLEMTKYDKDTSAAALVLFDVGNTKFVLDQDAGFKFNFTRHTQIKIFKKSALSLADVKIILYRSGRNAESFGALKAATFNLVNGKSVKTKLDNGSIYKSDNDHYTVLSFALPEVKEGSVLDISYQISSDFFGNLRGWSFQSNYPERWSQYTYEIPEYFQYRLSTKGYLDFTVNKPGEGAVNFSFTQGPGEPDRNGSRTPAEFKTIRAQTKLGNLAIKDVPAFVSEPGIDCEDNYLQSLEFELASVIYPNQAPRDFSTTWESVNKQMKEDSDFGDLLIKNTGFIKDTVDFLCSDRKTDLEKAISIYNYLQKRMKWNGTYSIWATKGLNKPFQEKVGKSSEMNLLLTMMLKSAGIKAYPVLFSTRENGIAISYFPTITKYNSVLTLATIGDKKYLLDVTDKFCPFGILPSEDINGKGRVVNDGGGDWVDLESPGKYSVQSDYDLRIDDEGNLTGIIKSVHDGYSAIALRNSLGKEKSQDDFYRKLQEKIKGLNIRKFTLRGTGSIYTPLVDSLDVEITENTETVGNKIMFRPLLFEVLEKNGYTLEDRKYPVNFNYMVSEHHVFNYTIPEGYTVESLPQPATLKMPDNSVVVTYNITSDGKKIKLDYSYEVNKVLFLQTDYKNIKSLFDQIVKKHAEQVILKK